MTPTTWMANDVVKGVLAQVSCESPVLVRRIHLALTAALTLTCALSSACKKPAPSSSEKTSAAPAAKSTASGTGDKSGKSLSNAKALTKGAGDTVTLPCDARVFYGPFAFSKSPEVLTLHGSATSPDGNQVCIGGEWVDSAGKFVAVAGIGCPEGSAATEQDQTLEYSPHNGGSGASPVFYVLKGAEKHGTTCPAARVTLSMR